MHYANLSVSVASCVLMFYWEYVCVIHVYTRYIPSCSLLLVFYAPGQKVLEEASVSMFKTYSAVGMQNEMHNDQSDSKLMLSKEEHRSVYKMD